jgi:hypothetical protein
MDHQVLKERGDLMVLSVQLAPQVLLAPLVKLESVVTQVTVVIQVLLVQQDPQAHLALLGSLVSQDKLAFQGQLVKVVTKEPKDRRVSKAHQVPQVNEERVDPLDPQVP